MPHVKLTAKQEAFCQAIADGLGQADAYRAAYDAKRMTENSVYVEASRIMENPKITQRVAELKAEVQKKQLWSREMSVKGLVSAFRVAQEGKNASGMTGAIKELNAMHGFNEPAKMDINLKTFPTNIDDLI